MIEKREAAPREGGPLLKKTTTNGPSDSIGPIANQAFDFHPLADIFPLMEGKEFDALVADIKANGLREGIVLFGDKILDGRNRYRACEAAGVTPGFRVAVQSPEQSNIARPLITDPAAYVVSANIHRRHLTAAQKRELIAKLIKSQPKKSDRQIAKQAKVSDKTVGAVRREKEARAEIPHVETRTDTKGRKQPAKKPEAKPSAEPKPAKRDARVISQKLGERVGVLAARLIELDADLARELAGLLLQPGVSTRLWNDLTMMLGGAVIDDRADGDAAS
jgi:hypothetical protein